MRHFIDCTAVLVCLWLLHLLLGDTVGADFRLVDFLPVRYFIEVGEALALARMVIHAASGVWYALTEFF